MFYNLGLSDPVNLTTSPPNTIYVFFLFRVPAEALILRALFLQDTNRIGHYYSTLEKILEVFRVWK